MVYTLCRGILGYVRLILFSSTFSDFNKKTTSATVWFDLNTETCIEINSQGIMNAFAKVYDNQSNTC